MKETTKMVMVLVIVSLLSATSLSIVYEKTKSTIENNKLGELQRSLKEIIPAERFEESSELNSLFSEGREGIKKVFDAYDGDNEKNGRVLLMDTIGFGGTIRMLVGVDNLKRISGVKILEHLETPGLGERITEDEFLGQFVGKPITLQIGELDAITGATISSEAVIETITENVNRVSEYLVEDGVTEATSYANETESKEVNGTTSPGNESTKEIIIKEDNKTIENAGN